jgi:DNA-binding response OmpR family regulator
MLYDSLVATRTNLKVLYMSGYTANANISRGVLDSDNVNYIQKPFSIGTIANKVREILDGSKPGRKAILEIDGLS